MARSKTKPAPVVAPVKADPPPAVEANDPIRLTAEPADPGGYGLLFQAWLVLFLLVICFALVSFLLPFLPRGS